MGASRRLAAWSGVAGAVVGFVVVLVAAARSPTFSWTRSALSNLGAPGATDPWLFNAGLVASGLLVLPFAWLVWSEASHPAQRAGALAFGVGTAGLGLVGIFPAGAALHRPAAIAYFAAWTLGILTHGAGSISVGERRRGVLSVGLGALHVGTWALWAAGLRVGPGLAVPEFVGSVLLFAWVVATTASLDGVSVPLPVPA